MYDKISRQNSDKIIDQQRDFIIIDKKIAIWVLCKKIDIYNLEIEDEIQKISTFIKKINLKNYILFVLVIKILNILSK